MAKEKSFDAVRMMREIRDRLSLEFQGMTLDEQRKAMRRIARENPRPKPAARRVPSLHDARTLARWRVRAVL